MASITSGGTAVVASSALAGRAVMRGAPSPVPGSV
jgi:hypothetical protein